MKIKEKKEQKQVRAGMKNAGIQGLSGFFNIKIKKIKNI